MPATKRARRSPLELVQRVTAQEIKKEYLPGYSIDTILRRMRTKPSFRKDVRKCTVSITDAAEIVNGY